jgi:serine/threonine-protein kinase
MELVEGPTLADRIIEGPIPLDEALRLGKQIAQALEAAHEQGIVHRDLKPANVKVRADGSVKVLDFGLAKSYEPAAAVSPGLSQSPTITTPAMTQAGVILGTAAYMSPEQARGRQADKRSDVWAFGCVLYEMLTGQGAFGGEDVADTLAAVIRGDPDWTALPPNLPDSIRSLLRRCLEKDRTRRVADISTARFVIEELERSGAPPSSFPTVSAPPWRGLVPLLAVATVVALVTSAAWWIARPPTPAAGVIRFALTLPEGQRFTENGPRILAFSRDGAQVVYVADRRLFLRAVSEVNARPIPGSEITEGFLGGPVFSPDGRSIVYWTGTSPDAGSLKKIGITGGTPVTICQVGFPYGISWGSDGIVFGQFESGIMRVAENGGEPQLLVGVKDGQAWGPQILPGGDAVLFTLAPKLRGLTGATTETWDKAQIVVHSLTTGERTTLRQSGTEATYLSTGHIVYAVAGTLFAVPFDVARRQATGGPVPVVEGVRRPSFGSTTPGTAYYSISDAGSLIYVPGPGSVSLAQSDLAYFDGKGNIERLNLRAADYQAPRVSPDGKRLAVQVGNAKESSIWIHDLTEATTPRQLTSDSRNRFPVWSHDGEHVLFQSDRDGDLGLFWQRADGSNAAERLTKPDKGVSHVPDAVSPDGKAVLVDVISEGDSVPHHSLDVLWLADRKLEPFGEVRSSSTLPLASSFSPNGRWVAYTVGDGVRPAAYVQRFPPTGEKQLVGERTYFTMWSHDGRELLFAQGGGYQVARVTTEPSFSLGTPTAFSLKGMSANVLERRNFDLMPDDRRVVGVVSIAQGAPGPAPSQIQVVINWFEELKRLAPSN